MYFSICEELARLPSHWLDDVHTYTLNDLISVCTSSCSLIVAHYFHFKMSQCVLQSTVVFYYRFYRYKKCVIVKKGVIGVICLYVIQDLIQGKTDL